MAKDPVNSVADSVEGATRGTWQTIKSTFNGAVRIAKPALIGATAVAALSFAMDPTLMAHVASDIATQEAATTLTGSVAQAGGNYLQYVGTGIANSGPVWEAGWEGLQTAGSGVADWVSNTDFTPT